MIEQQIVFVVILVAIACAIVANIDQALLADAVTQTSELLKGWSE